MIPGLDFIPKRLWIKINDMLELKIIPKGKKLINQSTVNPPCYVILTGVFELKQKYQDQAVQLLPGDICGDYYAFNDKRWKPARVIAIEDSSVAEFSSSSLQKLLLE